MTKVGDLKAYHDGTSYSVAELYDEEIAEYRKSFIENSLGAIHFDTDTGVRAEITKLNAITAIAPKFYNNGSAVADVTPYVTTEYAKFDYALKFSASNKNYLRDFNFSNMGGTDRTVEGWFYVDTTADSDTGTLFCLAGTNGSNAHPSVRISYSYTKENGVVKPKLNSNYDVDVGTFDAPFHVAMVWSNKVGGGLSYFCNGKKYLSVNYSTTHFLANSKSQIYGCVIGAAPKSTQSSTGNYYTLSYTAPYLTGCCSEFKVTSGVLYTADFTPPNKSSVWAKIPVEGNVAFKSASGTLYAPLSSDATYKTPPCLNVRHNGTNYFAIK